MSNYTNIITGEANLSLAAQTASNATVAADNLFTNVGFTQEGIELSWEPNMVEIEVDQFGDAARTIQSKIKVMIKTTFAEVTLANLTVVWGYTGSYGTTAATSATPGQVDSTHVNVGIHGATPEERQLRAVGPAAGNTAQAAISRTFTATRAVSWETSAGSWQRNDNYKLPVNFRILPNQGFTGKEYGTMVDA